MHISNVCRDRARGNGSKLKEHRFALDIRKSFPWRVMRQWNKSPRKAVDAPSLEVFQARMGGALGNLIWWVATLPMAVGLQPNRL